MDGDTIPLEVAVSEFFKKFRVGIYGRDNVRDGFFDRSSYTNPISIRIWNPFHKNRRDFI